MVGFFVFFALFVVVYFPAGGSTHGGSSGRRGFNCKERKERKDDSRRRLGSLCSMCSLWLSSSPVMAEPGSFRERRGDIRVIREIRGSGEEWVSVGRIGMSRPSGA